MLRASMDEIRFRFDYPHREPLELREPREVMLAAHIDDVVPALHRADEASRSGKWVAGFVAYEAAPAFDAAMRVRPPSDLPLLLLAVFDEPRQAGPLPAPQSRPALTPGVATAQTFKDAVATIRARIAEGAVYQVNHTVRLKATFAGDELALYHHLLRAQSGAYGACLQFHGHCIVSASPELFFRRTGTLLETRPMKGTRPRGRFVAEDNALAKELRESAKDRAENLMIVDLLRNDIGRVARFGSVRVPHLFDIERYETVWQMTSTILGEIPADTGLAKVFAALFPCGSVTGAPKIAAMDFIRALEATPRGAYCGAIGLVEPGGDCVFSVGIRTAWIDRRRNALQYGVGCGITWDSSADEEWGEALAKAAIFARRFPDFRLVETMRADGGVVRRLEAHLNRMQQSAGYFGFAFDRATVRAAIVEAARGAPAARVRVTVGPTGDARVATTALEPAPREPVPVAIASSPISDRDPFLFHKTTHREVHERLAHAHPNAFDVLLFNDSAVATEFTRGNLVAELDGIRFTPPRTAGLLAGVFRAELLERAEIQERALTLQDVKRATRLWWINSVREWVGARLID